MTKPNQYLPCEFCRYAARCDGEACYLEIAAQKEAQDVELGVVYPGHGGRGNHYITCSGPTERGEAR